MLTALHGVIASKSNTVVAGYLPGQSKLAINNGLQSFGTFTDLGNGDFMTSDGDVGATTKYTAQDNSRAFIRIGADTSCTFGLVDRYEVRSPTGLGVYNNGTRFVVFMRIGDTYTDFPDFNIQVGHYLGFRFNNTTTPKTLTPYYSTDGVNLITLTPPATFNYQDFTGGVPYFYITATRYTTVVKPQGSNFILVP